MINESQLAWCILYLDKWGEIKMLYQSMQKLEIQKTPGTNFKIRHDYFCIVYLEEGLRGS